MVQGIILYGMTEIREEDYMVERKVTVYKGSTKDHTPVPRITLQGQWLGSIGFSIGDRLTVKCEQGRLTIEKSGPEAENIEIGMVAEIAVKYNGGRATTA